jgi:hypothetical protein
VLPPHLLEGVPQQQWLQAGVQLLGHALKQDWVAKLPGGSRGFSSVITGRNALGLRPFPMSLLLDLLGCQRASKNMHV